MLQKWVLQFSSYPASLQFTLYNGVKSFFPKMLHNNYHSIIHFIIENDKVLVKINFVIENMERYQMVMFKYLGM